MSRLLRHASLRQYSTNTVKSVKPTDAAAKIVSDGYKRSTPPIAIPISKIITEKLFPLSVSESFKDYQRCRDLDAVQQDLLSLLPFHQRPTTGVIHDSKGVIPQEELHESTTSTPHRESQLLKVDIGNGQYINEFCIRPKNDVPYEDLNHFVLIHGYGAGLGFFLKNYDEISRKDNWCIHAIDLLGYGCSSRPKRQSQDSIDSWFLQSLEKWRLERGIDSMLMCSHSLGSYISLLYTQKHPGVVKKLMLISPAGIIEPLEPLKNVPRWFEMLWDLRVSPFSIVRNSGPLGSLFTSGWTSRRFAKLSKREQELLHKYSYAIFNAPGSGEYFLVDVLKVGGVPRDPLYNRIEDIVTCDTVWAYGDEDWIPKEGGLKSLEKIRKHTKFRGEVITVENSGHHIYLDNYKQFNQLILKEMEKYEREEYTTCS